MPHERFMQRCLQLALQGAGSVAPNPMVGAVLVHEDRIIGEGYHQRFGGPHAEVLALRSVKVEDEYLIPEATMYVSLEPCSHFGKTPPCADLLIEKRVKRVVIANTEPNPVVVGRGIKKLRDAGIEVMTGVLEVEGNFLNRRFFTFHKHKRPYIILKWAQSADGYFTQNNQQQHWITGDLSRRLVHRWRNEEQAILVGYRTVVVDNPELTVRLWEPRHQPLRIVLDRDNTLPAASKVFNDAAPTLLLSSKQRADFPVQQLIGPWKDGLPVQLYPILFERNIQSIIIEGGVATLQAFIAQGLWDEVRVFTGQTHFVSGVEAPRLPIAPATTETIGTDRLDIYYKP
ncbi:bifunctional diaminohydroxyphosphoribosylaminopyrimidine deaminase/5-amino-6-(5-phosphoribosylamino)uracil reductase RibD [soil metagenome]